MSEDQVRQLKVLSKAQTALLKALLHKKLSAVVDAVNKANASKTSIADLKKVLDKINLGEIEVDVKSTQLMMHEELAKLRGAVENGSTSTGAVSSSNSVGNSELNAKIKSLERENKELKDAAGDAGKEIAKLKSAGTAMVSNESNTTATLQLKEQEIKRLKESETSFKGSSEEKSKTISKQNLELEKLKSDLSTTKKELQDLKQSSVEAIKDAETRAEAEKEEIMEAMAQEVDEIEKSKEKELAAQKQAGAKNEKLSVHLKQVIKAQTAGIRLLKDSCSTTKNEQKALVMSAKREMDEVKQQMKTYYTSTLINGIKAVQDEMNATRIKYNREMTERKRLHNMVQELKGNIRVFMRCRPPTTKEFDQFGDDALCVSFPQQGEVRVFNEKNREKLWEFDETFEPKSKQENVYDEVSALVTSVLDGYCVCIFAYGQTGSGKTYTMTGPPSDRGVNTRALEDLFKRARDRSAEWTDTINVSLLEVYNENIKDLLVAPGDTQVKLDVKMGEFGNHVPGLTTVNVTNISEVLSLLEKADKNRSSTATNMNEHSSRSHMMLTVTIVSEYKETGMITRGKLNLVDLAGSERIDKSGATGQALKEAQNINKSLSALGDVIAARAMKQSHIPFRNSTLTFLLQDSLSQDSKTLMIVCVSPVLYNAEETFCSLNFASRVRTVELGKASKQTIKKK